MRLILRFVLPLALVMGLVAYCVVPLVDTLTLKWFVRDLDIRSSLISNTMQEPLADLIKADSVIKVSRFFDQVTQDERLYALGFCDEANILRF